MVFYTKNAIIRIYYWFYWIDLLFQCFIAEEFRAGIAGVSVGQQQASLALGLTWWQSMRFIILPQSFCIAFAPLIGQYMNIVKNSSLTMAIGVLELSYVSRQVETESLKTFQDFAIATFLYILAIVIIGTLGNIYQTKRFQTSKV